MGYENIKYQANFLRAGRLACRILDEVGQRASADHTANWIKIDGLVCLHLKYISDHEPVLLGVMAWHT